MHALSYLVARGSVVVVAVKAIVILECECNTAETEWMCH